MSDAAKREKRIARIVAAGVWIIRFFGWTWRIRVKHDAGLRRERQPGRPVIFSLWHGQMLPLLYHHRNEGVSILISEHGDGEIIARIAARLGFKTVRGSTSRGAARALLGMVRVLEEGNDLAITPDGPRGPAKTYAPGPLVVAQRSGRPIIPTVAVASSGWRLKSWDSFLIPRPFARVTIAYGEPVFIDAADARAATDSADRLREAMIAAEERASV
jgi:lysophospholipid acyltransferase (LPLAT)-like uncharacterized protein